MTKDTKNQIDYAYGLIPFYLEDGEPYYFAGLRTGGIFWKFPKGHMEPSETELEAAIRETAEEIGISIELDHVLTDQSFRESYMYTTEEGEIAKVNTYWLAQVEEGTEVNLNHEFSEYRWVRIDEAFDLLPENSRGCLRDAHDFLIKE